MNKIKSIVVGLGVVAALAGAISIAIAPTTSASQQPCVDARQISNLVFPAPGSSAWNMSGNKISGTVGLKDNKPACADTTIFLSSYTMPDTWDQKSFPATALPQTFIESQSVTFKAGQVTTPVTLTVSYPVPCKNVQVDLYYGPEIVNLTEQGHNGVYISHKFIRRDNEACKPRVTPAAPKVSDVCDTKNDTVTVPHTDGVSYLINGTITPAGTYPASGTVKVTAQAASAQYVMAPGATTEWTFTFTNEACPTPGQGGGSVDTPSTPQVLATSTTTPATLPATGSNTNQIITLALALAAFASGVTYLVRAKIAAISNR